MLIVIIVNNVPNSNVPRCNEARGPLAIIVPLGGFSAFDRQGGPFWDPEAPKFFAETLKKNLQPRIQLHLLPNHINDPEFSEFLLKALDHLLSQKGEYKI